MWIVVDLMYVRSVGGNIFNILEVIEGLEHCRTRNIGAFKKETETNIKTIVPLHKSLESGPSCLLTPINRY